jgi:hypothetical protein
MADHDKAYEVNRLTRLRKEQAKEDKEQAKKVSLVGIANGFLVFKFAYKKRFV